MADTLLDGAGTTQATDAATEGQTTEGQTTEGQTTEGQTTEGQTTEGETKAESAPEKYELTPAEGAVYDPAVIEAYTDVARELNLSNESAQKLLDKVAPVMVARQAEQIAAIQEGWRAETTADKEVGGANLEVNLGVAKKALEAFGTPELSTLLKESGLGNHPEVIRLLYRAGTKISQDGFVGGSPSTAGTEGIAAKLYPNQGKK